MNFPGITIQGNIVSSEILEKIRTEDIKNQSQADFNLDRKTSVRDEIGIAWAAARAHYTAFRIRVDRLKEGETGTTETRNSWIIPLLRELGYNVEKASAFIHPTSQKSYAISHQAANLEGFPIHIMGVNDDLDKRRETSGPRLSPHALVQEYLNNTEHVYALVTNGRFLRLLRDATRLVRISYLEFNLEKIMEEELYTDFAIFFRLLHATRMPKKADEVESSFIEYYHQESLASGSRIREKLSKAVEDSIKELANGFLRHPKNSVLREQIAAETFKPSAYYLYQLRLIYRLLFLIVTEERNLVFPDTREESIQRKRDIYYRHYSIERLRKLASRQHFVDGRKHDLWEGLKATFLLFEKEYYGNKLGIMPLGSGIFSYDALGLLPELKLDNESLLKVIRYLTLFRNDQQQWVRVNYSDLDVEEFGSVYEGLLEYDAVFVELAGQPVFDFRKGSGRSSSGSHYTPEELVKPLIKHSLDYIIEDKLKEADREAALLSITVCDVACGSGHILLSASRRIATELAIVRTGEEQPSPTAMRKATRDVIRNCIYGVDKNPLAVELCKVALWLESHNPGEPLGFLDHHIKCGDAIVGLAHREELENGIADEAFKTLPGDDKDIARALRDKNSRERKERIAKATQLKAEFEKTTENSVQESMVEYKTFNQLPESNPEEIVHKAKMYQKFMGGKGYGFLKAMADTQVAQFFIPKSNENKDSFMTDADFRQIISGYKGWQDRKVAKASVISSEHRFFHWFLEFPEVFNKGGFDCIIGNPPFLGGGKISTNFGKEYLTYLQSYYTPIGGQCDFVAYFFRRNFTLINKDGFIALISTNTISQGDTREGSLDVIMNSGGSINFAIKSMVWPGTAAVYITLICLNRRNHIKKVLGSKFVENINTFLNESIQEIPPFIILQNSLKAFLGSGPVGDGFLRSVQEATFLIKKNIQNLQILKPYLTGDDLNRFHNQVASRYAIYFYDWDIYKAMTFKECFEIIKRDVKPERDKNNDKRRREIWWQFSRPTVELYNEIQKYNYRNVLAQARVSKTHAISFVNSDQIFSDALVVFNFSSNSKFSILQSSLHEDWAWKYSSTMKGDRRYTPSDCFEPFPFPQNLDNKEEQELEYIGKTYNEYRQKLMLILQLGLTKTYNLFHAPEIQYLDISSSLVGFGKKSTEKKYGKDVWNLCNHLQKSPGTCSIEEAIDGIVKLRELHVEMDNAVLGAYGWQDVQLRHDFYEVDYLPENDRIRFTSHPDARKEILKRLLELNHRIHAEEVAAGLWDKKSTKVKEHKVVDKEAMMVKEREKGLGDLFG